MMSIENPEAFAEIVCLASGESQKPLYIMSDTSFETMSNPDQFPYGTGCFSAKRPRRLTYEKYFNQSLLNGGGRFASDTDYLFTAQYIVKAKKIQDDCNHFIFRQKPGILTASQARDESFVSQYLRKDKACRFMSEVLLITNVHFMKINVSNDSSAMHPYMVFHIVGSRYEMA